MNDVLVVGAGPAGLTAITLARLGIAPLLVEKRPGLSPFPRGQHAQHGTVPLVGPGGPDAGRRHTGSAGGLGVRDAGRAGRDGRVHRFPDVEQAHALSPTSPALAPQDHVEPVLLAHLRGYRHAEVRFDTELVALSSDADGVTAVRPR